MAANAILSAQVSLRERGIHDRNILAVRCIARGEKASRSKRYLQCLEIRGRHINQVGHILIARLWTIGDSYRVVERAFIRNRQPHSGSLHPWNVLHGFHAFTQQL